MKNLIMLLISSIGSSLDFLATDPAIKAAMPSEMYDLL